MKLILTRTAALAMTLILLITLLVPWAAAITYPGVPEITIDAQSALLIDLDTEQLLYEQNASEKRYPASITKIMTCLLTLEAIGRGELSMDTVITIPPEALADISSDSSTAGLQIGEEITVNDLLYCLMLASANEAANALAIAVAGDIPSFVERMNQRAAELGMDGTHFVNPHGLHDDDHYTTAWDIFRMAKEAMTHAPFREIVSTGRYDTAATNMSDPRQLYNTNALLARYVYPGHVYGGTIGIKTGSTGQAGYCLCAAAKKKGHTLVSVVLGADNPTDKWGNPIRMQFIESRRLLDWGFTSFSPATLLSSETYLQEVPVKNSFQATHVVLQPVDSVKTLVPGAYDKNLLELRLHLEKEAPSAPINAGDVLGSVTVIYNGQDFGTVDMAAVSDVSYSPFLAFVSGVNTVLGNLYVRLALLTALVLIVVGVTRRYLGEQHQLRKQARIERKATRQKEAQARKEQTAREKAAYEVQQAEKRRIQEEERKKKEEADRIRRQQEEEARQLRRQQEEEAKRIRRQQEEERRRRKEEERQRRQELERRRQEELDRRRQEEQARREEERRRQEEQARRDRERRRQAEQARRELERRRQEERARREQERRRQEEQARREQERYYASRSSDQRRRDGQRYDDRSGRSHAYDDRSYGDRSYGDRFYDDRSYGGRSYNDRSYDSRSYDRRGYDRYDDPPRRRDDRRYDDRSRRRDYDDWDY